MTPQQAAHRLRGVILCGCRPDDNARMTAIEQIANVFECTPHQFAVMLSDWSSNRSSGLDDENYFTPERMASWIWWDFLKLKRVDNAMILLTGKTAFDWIREMDW